MNNLKYKLMTFMQGRYGSDKFNFALMILYFIIAVTRRFIRNPVVFYIAGALMSAILIFAVYRMFSRSIEKRQRENTIFCIYLSKIKSEAILLKDRVRDIRTRRYRRCPSCKKVLRLPYKRGKHNVKCPECGNNFEVHII